MKRKTQCDQSISYKRISRKKSTFDDFIGLNDSLILRIVYLLSLPYRIKESNILLKIFCHNCHQQIKKNESEENSFVFDFMCNIQKGCSFQHSHSKKNWRKVQNMLTFDFLTTKQRIINHY